MYRARDQFLACAGLTINQHCGTSRSNGFDLAENGPKSLTVPYYLVEATLGANFVFEIKVLLREFIFEVGDLTICQRIFHCNRHLIRHLGKETDILWNKGIPASSQAHNAENLVTVDQW